MLILDSKTFRFDPFSNFQSFYFSNFQTMNEATVPAGQKLEKIFKV